MTLTIDLTPNLENLVRARVESGVYKNASEVVADALKLMESAEHHYASAKFEQLKSDIHEGIASGSAGTLDIEAIIQRGHARHSNPS